MVFGGVPQPRFGGFQQPAFLGGPYGASGAGGSRRDSRPGFPRAWLHAPSAAAVVGRCTALNGGAVCPAARSQPRGGHVHAGDRQGARVDAFTRAAASSPPAEQRLKRAGFYGEPS